MQERPSPNSHDLTFPPPLPFSPLLRGSGGRPITLGIFGIKDARR